MLVLFLVLSSIVLIFGILYIFDNCYGTEVLKNPTFYKATGIILLIEIVMFFIIVGATTIKAKNYVQKYQAQFEVLQEEYEENPNNYIYAQYLELKIEYEKEKAESNLWYSTYIFGNPYNKYDPVLEIE